MTDKLILTNEDNMALMALYPDKYFDLAIVDPPYGIDVNSMTLGGGSIKVMARSGIMLLHHKITLTNSLGYLKIR